MYHAERPGDLRAQIAANELGARRLVELAERIGVANLRTSIEELLDYGERRGRPASGVEPRAARSADLVTEYRSPDAVGLMPPPPGEPSCQAGVAGGRAR